MMRHVIMLAGLSTPLTEGLGIDQIFVIFAVKSLDEMSGSIIEPSGATTS